MYDVVVETEGRGVDDDACVCVSLLADVQQPQHVVNTMDQTIYIFTVTADETDSRTQRVRAEADWLCKLTPIRAQSIE